MKDNKEDVWRTENLLDEKLWRLEKSIVNIVNIIKEKEGETLEDY